MRVSLEHDFKQRRDPHHPLAPYVQGAWSAVIRAGCYLPDGKGEPLLDGAEAFVLSFFFFGFLSSFLDFC